ncbi:hypothetical protein DXK93_01575 [Achromobacter sp. K91]|nr:hypothetical protein DXK93_01575 [Achromobacter sp. K91]
MVSWQRDQVRMRTPVDGLQHCDDVVVGRVDARLLKVKKAQQLVAADRAISEHEVLGRARRPSAEGRRRLRCLLCSGGPRTRLNWRPAEQVARHARTSNQPATTETAPTFAARRKLYSAVGRQHPDVFPQEATEILPATRRR